MTGHVRQAVAAVAAGIVEYVPAMQGVHAPVPVPTLYVPAAHVEHMPSGPVYPALQGTGMQELMDELAMDEVEPSGHATQVAAVVAPVVGEYVPAAQSVHMALPVSILYLPVMQAVHTPPSGPVEPALQVQAVMVVLASGALEPSGHARHAAADVAAAVGEYVPAEQGVHEEEPVALL